MQKPYKFDVAIIGGSYAGLSAAMTLGRARRQVVVIDSGKPCNRQTPHSHNLITHDGKTPAEISALAREQVFAYPTVHMHAGLVIKVMGKDGAFTVMTEEGQNLEAKKLIFTTGIRDIMPEIAGFSQCWGISAIHCPYCHGYEYSEARTGVLINGEMALEYLKMIRNWTADLTLYTNGSAEFDQAAREKMLAFGAEIVETPIARLDHENGYLKMLHLTDGTAREITALYHRPAFVQHCLLPQEFGCELNPQGFIKVDEAQKTTMAGIYAAGDNSGAFRGLTGAMAAGTVAGARLNHELISEEY
ncbi:MAG: pyridine nucleotide-disulfide oxidoreductase [Dyadobacter sp. 50-39]|uniref:NAD(P)/FAD-dependent oxidoreductase n=1 Tax=Dyadobacter sp. 50-39 TaxID=1895756 RepID=UPI000962DFC2|nr:NAD(P)/FAD-dependent oxidoreductase [Dyadobacter sp. 50-39]OJV12961.1 MAG: pyridine nucleotide-disulfide oxidoreductase [Dyadobacter sp. 50-39]